jgi:UDP-N-acetyl-D-mannosaminuronate dehydrogenase
MMPRPIYKVTVDDFIELPFFVLIEKLLAKGVTADCNDPFAPIVPVNSKHTHFIDRQSVDIGDIYDLILVSTDNTE